MRHKVDLKAKKMIFVGYDRFTDKVYRVFDSEKIVEWVADVTIEDITNTTEQVIFPLLSEEQEEDSEELLNDKSQVKDSTESDNSNDEFYSDKGEIIEIFTGVSEKEKTATRITILSEISTSVRPSAAG